MLFGSTKLSDLQVYKRDIKDVECLSRRVAQCLLGLQRGLDCAPSEQARSGPSREAARGSCGAVGHWEDAISNQLKGGSPE